MFGTTPKKRFFRALKKGDLKAVRELLENTPNLLTEIFELPRCRGTALHVAAYYNRPEIIDFLVNEKKMGISCSVSHGWLPLHHAAYGAALEASRKLIELGADPLITTEDNSSPYGLTPSGSATEKLFAKARAENDRKAMLTLEEASKRQILLAEEKAREKQRQKEADEVAKRAGQWVLSAHAEVMFGRTLPVNGYRLTEIFNFETRRWISITETYNGHVAQNDRFFDEVADKEILRQALAKFTELGGKANPDIIDRRPIDKPKPAGMGG
jgi:hypothetical protein